MSGAMNEGILRILTTFFNEMELAIRRAKEEIARIIEKELSFSVIQAPQPVSADSAPIRWLQRRLEEIRARHPNIEYEFLRGSDGSILGLRFRASDEESRMDIEAPATWAFKAALKPAPSNKEETKT